MGRMTPTGMIRSGVAAHVPFEGGAGETVRRKLMRDLILREPPIMASPWGI